MLAPFATLAFLVLLWLIAFSFAGLLGQPEKIVAALKGSSLLAVAPRVGPVAMRLSLRYRSRRTRHVQPQLCAAA